MDKPQRCAHGYDIWCAHPFGCLMGVCVGQALAAQSQERVSMPLEYLGKQNQLITGLQRALILAGHKRECPVVQEGATTCTCVTNEHKLNVITEQALEGWKEFIQQVRESALADLAATVRRRRWWQVWK